MEWSFLIPSRSTASALTRKNCKTGSVVEALWTSPSH
uniref:Uncharacterized protein n=1 Tax=Lepeophtheirus salmonis TaxID=72036 RepID=A0A0K2V4U5_LEPSM